MNITITPFYINKQQSIKATNKVEKQSISTETTTNPVLPNYRNYLTNISFGKKAKITIPAEEFMLPSSATPDIYQIKSAQALAKGSNLIVTAPTGTGKTAIAHYIIKKNFEAKQKTFYTTPLKALSNQKYEDLKTLFGKENVGILTGDRKEKIHAPIVVMTTEIYHNMVTSNYFGKNNDMLKGLKTIVFDEFHYMGDPDRGHVWEESIMFTPDATQILALSATVGNNTKIEKWIDSITDKSTKLVDVPIEARHVPLKFSYLVDGKLTDAETSSFDIKALEAAFGQGKLTDKQSEALGEIAEGMGYKNNNKGRGKAISVLKDTFKNKKVSNSDIVEFLKAKYNMTPAKTEVAIATLSIKKENKPQTGPKIISSTATKPPAANVILNLIRTLRGEKKLPAIAFVFSKQYADELLTASARSGADLTTDEEKQEITKHIEKYKNELGLYTNNLNENALLKGYAIHSAAILPLQKQLIEELFNKRLLKVAYATETLAAGINMPAKTVIMTDFKKPRGEAIITNGKPDIMRNLMANEFHQMTGRAGRRGIDTVGYVVLVAQNDAAHSIFEDLRTSKANNVESAYKTDASSVTGFLANSNDLSRMKYILQSSFFAASENKEEAEKKLDAHMRTLNNYLSLLIQFGFAEKCKEGHKLTPAGHLISDLKGVQQIPIVTALLNNRLAHLTPVELAGVISAIVVQPKVQVFPIPPMPLYTNQETSMQTLQDINRQIDSKLETELKISNVTSSNSNQEIMSEIEKVYKDVLAENLDDITEQLESIKKEKEAIKRSVTINTPEAKSKLTKLGELEKPLKYKRAILRKIAFLEEKLQERLGILSYILAAMKDDSIVRNNAYNEIAEDFNLYNQQAEKTASHLPKAALNQQAFELVYRWANRNKTSADHNANWDYMCGFLSKDSDIKYEGDLFNAIAQTIDFIHQLEDTVDHAQTINGLDAETEYYGMLKANLKEAVRLLKQPPLYSTDEIK